MAEMCCIFSVQPSLCTTYYLNLFNISYFYMPVRRDVLCYGVVCPSAVIYSFPDFFFFFHRCSNCIETWCIVGKTYRSSSHFGEVDSFLQDLHPRNLKEFRNFSVLQTFFLPSLQLLQWRLVYCFLVKSYYSNSCFGVIDSFLQELCPWNLKELRIF
jgi:hypothetical protein